MSTNNPYGFILRPMNGNSPSSADKLYARGVAAYTGSDSSADEYDAYDYWLDAADKGNPLAQYNMYLCYLNGVGYKEAKYVAYRYLKQSADNGCPEAIEAYANALEAGVPGYVDKDEAQAAVYRDKNPHASMREKAYDSGLPKTSQTTLDDFFDPQKLREQGDAFAFGRGVKKDLTKAVERYTSGIRHGGTYNLFNCLHDAGITNEVLRDLPEAQDYLCELGDDLYYGRYDLQKDIAKANKLYDLLPNTHPRAACMAGVCRYLGQGYSNTERASGYILASRQIEHYPDRTDLSEGYYIKGLYLCDLERYAEAFNCFLRAAKEGIVPAMSFLSALYHQGQGVAKNDQQSFYWTKKAVDMGDTYAIFTIGEYYYHGYGCTKDLYKARQYFKEGFVKGQIVGAGYDLALMTAKGEGGKEDLKEAKRLCEEVLAIDPNYENAKKLLAELNVVVKS